MQEETPFRIDKEKHLFSYRHFDEETQIEVIVRPAHVPSKSSPPNNYYVFCYYVDIINNSPETIQIIRRHWIIRDAQKKERFINGEGVVGQRPKIEPGHKFSYQSFCPLNSPTGNMRGKYQILDSEKRSFWVTIPLFFLRTAESFLQ